MLIFNSLAGNLIGIHNVGSYGTRGIVKAAGGYNINQLGLVANYKKTGWMKGYAGDFTIPDNPLEGARRDDVKNDISYAYLR